MNSSVASGLRRFWWIVVLGVLVAATAGLLVVYNVESLAPPKLTERTPPTYSADARVLVTSAGAPHFRTTVERLESTPATVSSGSAPLRVQETPDTRILVNAANVYPLFIDSDEVRALREKMFGTIPGENEVAAQAIYSGATARRYEPSEFPVIELIATADSPSDAVALATTTAKAFQTWIVRQQNTEKVPAKDRIQLRPLRAPSEITSTSNTPYELAALAVIALAGAFVLLAILLDRLFPRTATRLAVDEEHVAPVAQGLERRVGTG